MKGADDATMSSSNLVTASPLKLRVSNIVASKAAGHVIGVALRKRIPHQGIWFDTRSCDFTPRVRAQMFWGGYEGAETRMIRTFLHNATTVIELGSSLGVTTAHLLESMEPGGHLVAVEANPTLISGLRQRTFARGANVSIEVIHAAITNYCGTVELVVGSETVGSRIGVPMQQERTVTVPALTLREVLIRTNTIEFDLVSDIEGAESVFLLTDPGVLAGCRRAVLELHNTVVNNRHVTVDDLIDAATANGFRVVMRHGPVVALSR